MNNINILTVILGRLTQANITASSGKNGLSCAKLSNCEQTEEIFLIDRWSLPSDVRRTAPDALEARVFVPEDSIWFPGHFPGEPILPGIAVVHAVYETIRQDAQFRGMRVHISHLKRIRFTSPVRPGDTLLIRITSEVTSAEIHYMFKVTVGENTVSSGLVAVTKM